MLAEQSMLYYTYFELFIHLNEFLIFLLLFCLYMLITVTVLDFVNLYITILPKLGDA